MGDIHITAGPASGGVDSFFATIFGKGGHGASPHTGIDPIYITGHLLLALHGIVSRRLSPFAPAVVTVGGLHGGQAENVIPDRIELSGTIRFLEKEVQAQIHTEVERALSIARLMGGDYDLNLQIGTPPMTNDPGVVHTMSGAAADLLGSEHVLPPVDGLGAEDFGCFSEIAPGAMFSPGCEIEGDERDAVRLEPEDMDKGYQAEPHPYIPGALMIAHRPNGDCVYLGEGGCTIHDTAPSLCRAADCRAVALRYDFISARRLHALGRLDIRVWDKGRQLIEQSPGKGQ